MFRLFTLILFNNAILDSFRFYSNRMCKLRSFNLRSKALKPLRETVKDLDEYMYSMLLKELSKLSENNAALNDEICEGSEEDTSNMKRIESRSLIEKVTYLTKNCPIEVIHKKRISFGNFVEQNVDGKSISVRLASGSLINVDVGQIISCWELLSDDSPPISTEDWARIASDAIEILGSIQPRKSDLQNFWQQVSSRGTIIPVDSFDLGVYIFQERRFRAWINPGMSSEDAGARALSAAQRYAAALLLFNDDFHFKRKPSRLASGKDISNQMEIGDDDETITSDNSDVLMIVEGGYKVLDEGLALYREGEVFTKYYEARLQQLQRARSSSKEALSSTATSANGSNYDDDDDDREPFRAGCISRQLRALEMYAMSPQGLDPPSSVKHILKRLHQELDPQGAVAILDNIKWNTRGSVATADASSGKQRSYTSVTPWSAIELQTAQAIQSDADMLRQQWSGAPTVRSGKRGPSGRMDYRSSWREHPCICVDAKAASFFDDAFSLSPSTGELLVHVVDVCALLRRYPVLQETARERISSTFLPTGPLHMLPPQALEGLKLSSTGPNEVITVALSVDGDSGSLLGYRVFPAVIGPVVAIDVDTADELLAGVGVDMSLGIGEERSARAGCTDQLVQDLLRTQRLVQKVISKEPWVDLQFSTAVARKFSLHKKSGTYEQSFVDKTPASRMVNALLSLYSNVTHEFCQDRAVPTPLAWENRDRIETSRARRHATQPLRSWIAQLQQKQLRAALKMELPLSRAECAAAVSHHNTKRKTFSPLQNLGRGQMLFESFEAHCASLQSTGGGDVVVVAQGLGRGGAVRIKDFLVEGAVEVPVARGQEVRVRVLRINAENKNVVLELA